MRVIELDASGWLNAMAAVDALKQAIGSPEGHGASPDAFVDSMIFGGMNELEPPYTIRIAGLAKASTPARDFISNLAGALVAQGGVEVRPRVGAEMGDTIELQLNW